MYRLMGRLHAGAAAGPRREAGQGTVEYVGADPAGRAGDGRSDRGDEGLQDRPGSGARRRDHREDQGGGAEGAVLRPARSRGPGPGPAAGRSAVFPARRVPLWDGTPWTPMLQTGLEAGSARASNRRRALEARRPPSCHHWRSWRRTIERCRSPSSTPESAVSPCCTNVSCRFRTRTSSTSATPRASRTATARRRSCCAFARELAGILLERGAKLLVVACNSATAAALPALRDELGAGCRWSGSCGPSRGWRRRSRGTAGSG